MEKSIYQAVSELQDAQGSGALCTIVHSAGSTPRHQGSKMLVYSDGHFIGTVGGGEVETRIINEALDSILTGKPKLLTYSMVSPDRGDPGICGGNLEVYIDPIIPKPSLVVIGGGHVGKAVTRLAKWLGFQVAVSDDREEYCTKEANPDADLFLPFPMRELPDHIKFSSQTYLVLTTRGAPIDIEGIPRLLEGPFAYMGVIGSKRRWTVTRKGLIDQGIDQEKIARIHSPIGLEINAETPEEIAVSVMAEIISVQHGGSGQHLKI